MNQRLTRIRRKHGASIRTFLLIAVTVLSFIFYVAADQDLSVLVTTGLVLMVISMIAAVLFT